MYWEKLKICTKFYCFENIYVHLLKKDFYIDAWKVYFIYANTEAIKKNKRYIEKNMNRCFFNKVSGETYEEQRVQNIIPYLKKSEYLLDIHNTTNKYASVPMLISEYPEIGKYFNVQYIVSWFDSLHPWWSDGYMNSIGEKWLCIECGSIYDNNWSKLAKESIINFLRFTGNLDTKALSYKKQSYIKFDTIYKNKTNTFTFEKWFRDMEKIYAWQIIAYDGKEKIIAESNWYILFPDIPKNIWDECFVLWKEKKIQ